MKVIVATAELAPIASVGGLGSAVSGLVRELRAIGHDVDVVLPDYSDEPLDDEQAPETLDTPAWTGPMYARRGTHPRSGPVTLVGGAGLARAHPYLDTSGEGWPDNEHRFFAFSAAVRAVATAAMPDVLHLNDWHTATALADDLPVPTVLTVHNLAYQGWAERGWLARLGARAAAFERDGSCNALVGALRRADAVAVVSPRYREEVLQPAHGCGLTDVLVARGDALVGILNGVESDVWDPEHDAALVAPFGIDDLDAKARTLELVRHELGLDAREQHGARRALTVIVSRLAHQKGIDLVLPLLEYLGGLRAQVAVLGNGDADTASRLRAAAAADPANVAFVEGFDEDLGHRLIGGGDLLLMPSRFEPCGLTQMQAMRYGTLPIVTGVGGLLDTVVDADADAHGTGFIAPAPDPVALLDAWHRAVRAWGNRARRRAIQRRAMRTDWSWTEPARRYVALYEDVIATRA